MTTGREPLVLSESEHAELERVMAAAGIASKRELVARAVALFGEVAAGRTPAPPEAAKGTLTLADLLPPPPRWSWRRLWGWWRPTPLHGRTADEVLRDLRGEGGGHATAAGEGRTGGR